jgi:uncharacterized protein DUF4440
MFAMFDALEVTKALQEAVRVRDREYLEAAVSDRMIWVMPVAENRRGKREWIEASCSVTWNWFQVDLHRELDVGDARVVECWISQSRDPVVGVEGKGPVTATGLVLDVWTQENGIWRLVTRHPQRAEDRR